jgi:hypothetical protein
MRSLYIIILLILVLIVFNNYNYFNEAYKNEPYITVFAKHGLNNKLRVTLSYLYKANKEKKKLRIYWITNSECNEKFDNLFEPIKNVEFIYSYDKNNIFDYNTCFEYNNEYIKHNYYKLLKPLSPIKKLINLYLIKLKNNFIACHIRRTDLESSFNTPSLHSWYKHKTDDDYINFINQYDNKYKIFIATDNKNTQDKFRKLYGDRLICNPISTTNALRQTSIQEAVVDMYVCSYAKDFLGTNISSFSETINYLRQINKIF